MSKAALIKTTKKEIDKLWGAMYRAKERLTAAERELVSAKRTLSRIESDIKQKDYLLAALKE